MPRTRSPARINNISQKAGIERQRKFTSQTIGNNNGLHERQHTRIHLSRAMIITKGIALIPRECCIIIEYLETESGKKRHRRIYLRDAIAKYMTLMDQRATVNKIYDKIFEKQHKRYVRNIDRDVIEKLIDSLIHSELIGSYSGSGRRTTDGDDHVGRRAPLPSSSITTGTGTGTVSMDSSQQQQQQHVPQLQIDQDVHDIMTEKGNNNNNNSQNNNSSSTNQNSGSSTQRDDTPDKSPLTDHLSSLASLPPLSASSNPSRSPINDAGVPMKSNNVAPVILSGTTRQQQQHEEELEYEEHTDAETEYGHEESIDGPQHGDDGPYSANNDNSGTTTNITINNDEQHHQDSYAYEDSYDVDHDDYHDEAYDDNFDEDFDEHLMMNGDDNHYDEDEVFEEDNFGEDIDFDEEISSSYLDDGGYGGDGEHNHDEEKEETEEGSETMADVKASETNGDLNRASDAELREAKAKMSVHFEKNRIRENDPEYQYDVQREFQPNKSSGWDSSSSDDDDEEE